MTHPTHAEGVELLARYARDELRSIIDPLTEPVAPGVYEIPDCICWPRFGPVVLDWKCSQSDAAAHFSKPHVTSPFIGMGVARYLAFNQHVVEPGLLPLEEFGWGALELRRGSLHVVCEPRLFRRDSEHNTRDETALLLQALRNYQIETRKAPSEVRAGSRDVKLPKQHHAEIRNLLADFGQASALELARAIKVKGKRVGTVASHIAMDAEAGLIDGVACAGTPAVLWLEESKVKEAG